MENSRSPMRTASIDLSLPIGDVVQLQNETKKALKEKDFLMASNAIKRVNLKEQLNKVAVLQQGNTAVNKEIIRMNEENSTLLDAHLSSKNVVLNLCNENENDCQLLQQFEDTNQLIREQLDLEKRKID